MNRTVKLALHVRHELNWFRIIANKFSSKHLDLPSSAVHLETVEKISLDKIALDTDTIHLLERLALVNFGSEKTKEILQDAIKFANKIHSVNTDNIEPLVNVLDDYYATPLRDDVVHMENSMQDVMLNAKDAEEDYYVAPPSNVPLHQVNDEKDIGRDTTKPASVV